MGYTLGIRQALNQKGIQNSDIGYDPQSNYVTVHGQNFMQPQKNYNGSTYTDQPSFDTAWNSHQKTNPYTGALFNPTDGNLPYQQRLVNYAQNPQAGQTELQRAKQALGVYNALGDTQKAGAAQHWIGQLEQVIPQTQPQTQPQDTKNNQYNDLISGLISKLNTPQNYDVYQDPQYQAAMQQQNYLTNQANRQVQETMGQTGFARSTNLPDRMAQNNTQSQAYLASQVVPGLVQQHNALQQQQFGNQANLINMLMNQQNQQFNQGIQEGQLTGNYKGDTTMQAKQLIASLTGKMPDGSQTYQAQQDSIKNALDQVNTLGYVTKEASALLGVPEGTTSRAMQALMNDMAYKNAELGLRNDSNKIALGRLNNAINSTSKRNDYYDARTAEANANLNKTPNKSATSYKNDPDFANTFSFIQKNPTEAANLLKTNSSQFIQEYGMDGYNALRNELKAIQDAQVQSQP